MNDQWHATEMSERLMEYAYLTPEPPNERGTPRGRRPENGMYPPRADWDMWAQDGPDGKPWAVRFATHFGLRAHTPPPPVRFDLPPLLARHPDRRPGSRTDDSRHLRRSAA